MKDLPSVADASHKFALVHVMRGLFNLLRADIAKNLADLRTDSEAHQRVQKQHLEIFEAIRQGDPEGAREAANRHLSFVGATLRVGHRAWRLEVVADSPRIGRIRSSSPIVLRVP